jgi:dephospho-CoA kinase
VQLIGLTGGIASGKSTVRKMLVELGAHVLDADAVYHDLIQPQAGAASPLAQQIGARFPGVVGPTGELDRKQLGELVFKDAGEREALGRITHPAIAQETARRIQELAAAGVSRVVYDVPLLFERGLEGGMQGVIVVWVPESVQLERLMARDQMTHEAALQRVRSQMSIEEKRGLATWVIDNRGSREETRAQVERLWRQIS